MRRIVDFTAGLLKLAPGMQVKIGCLGFFMRMINNLASKQRNQHLLRQHNYVTFYDSNVVTGDLSCVGCVQLH
jgi:FtsZ-interacting cell division protein YlmF